MTTNGQCDPRFSAVREAFEEGFVTRGELGASVAVTLDGVPVVELWKGFTDKARQKPWKKDTLVNVYSTTKGLTAVVAHQLVEDGVLDLDAPVTRYWPEFSAPEVRVHMLLDHQAGLPALRETLPPEALFDWETMTGALAKETPWWKPGSQHGYHPFTFGWLVGEVVRRASGKTVGALLRERISGPLGLDAHIGLAEADDPRCADLSSMPRDRDAAPSLIERVMGDPMSMTARAFTNPISMVMPGTVTSRAWRGAELPGVNGHVTAASVARFYGALSRGGEIDGVRILTPATIERARQERSAGPDATLQIPTRFGLGFMLTHAGALLGPNQDAFGHTGAGGSLGFADPTARIGFAYVPNRTGTSILLDPRAQALIEATYASL